jgi:Rnl2 family RNA ligase
MNYQGYNKIPLQSSEWKNFNPKNSKKWYVTEKCHGSCFCFIYDVVTKNITYGKRKGIISNDENFFGFRSILPHTLPKILKICDDVLKKVKGLTEIHIFGELFGGSNESIQSKPVQSGIYYSDTLHFYAFDISYIQIECNEEIYLDFEESLKIFKVSDILYSEPLAQFDTLNKAISFSFEFQSTLPKKLGTSNLNVPEFNKAEGVVIRSSHGHYLLKQKIPEFSEEKYGDNNYESADNNLSPLEIYKKKAMNCLTVARINNATSKFGEFEKYKESILEEVLFDILSEINGFHIYKLKEYLDNEINIFCNNL